jgi:hypothetical protein
LAKRTHGMSKTKFWKSWHNMVAAHSEVVCPRWLDFESFCADMAPRPEGTVLRRLDNSQDYGPGNCEWVSPALMHATQVMRGPDRRPRKRLRSEHLLPLDPGQEQ